jgi:hypothetical protein
MTYTNFIGQLKPCCECGETDLRWCGISVRPYCNDCKNWGFINYGTPEDAIKSWNERYEKTLIQYDAEQSFIKLKQYSEQIGMKLTIEDLIRFHKIHTSNLWATTR